MLDFHFPATNTQLMANDGKFEQHLATDGKVEQHLAIDGKVEQHLAIDSKFEQHLAISLDEKEGTELVYDARKTNRGRPEGDFANFYKELE